MSSLILASTGLALALYVPLCIQILSGKAKQNLTTWLLWATLDAIVACTLIAQHGNYFLPVAYTVGSGITVLCIAKSKNAKWTWFESFVTFLVVVCLIVWAVSGARTATIASTCAMLIAGIPQLVDCYRKPWDTPIPIYLGYVVANGLSVMGGKNWAIEERFYPASAAIYCLVVATLALRKRWIKPANVPVT
jgi:hypothetical protein